MDRNEEDRRERLRRTGDRRPGETGRDDAERQDAESRDVSDVSGGYGGDTGSGSSREDGREKGTLDKLIDQAQEKGYFDKAERFFRDKFGGGGSRRR